MSDRYWVGGDGNTSDTAHWSLTSGGAGGAAAPTSSDDVFFNSLSHTTGYTITFDATFTCRNITYAPPASGNITRAGSAAMSIHGSLTMYLGMVSTYTGVTTFRSTSMGNTITTAGVTVTNQWRFNGVGGGWALADALTHTGTNILLDAGTLDFAGYTVTCNSFNTNNSNVRSLYLRGSTINLPSTGTIWELSTTTNLTFDAGTSTIVASNTTATSKSWRGGGLNYHNVTFSGDVITLFNSNNSFYNFYVATAGLATGLRITSGTTQTIRGAFYTNGFAGNLAKIVSVTAASPFTLAKTNGMVSVDYMSIKDCTTSGGNGWYAGVNSTNVSGNTGWTFTAPPTWAAISSDAGVSQSVLSQGNGVSKILTASIDGVAV